MWAVTKPTGWDSFEKGLAYSLCPHVQAISRIVESELLIPLLATL